MIVENAETEKFVQFTGSLGRPLALDLAAEALSEAEFYRAVAFFRRRGVVGREHELFDAPGGRPLGEQFTFQYPLRSIADAVEVTLSIFDEVYHTPGCNLKVTSD